jgi:hypothetical protein
MVKSARSLIQSAAALVNAILTSSALAAPTIDADALSSVHVIPVAAGAFSR